MSKPEAQKKSFPVKMLVISVLFLFLFGGGLIVWKGGLLAKLWEKDYSTDKLIEEFTVGRDYRLDMNLIPSDCIASMAHARMLQIGYVLQTGGLFPFLSVRENIGMRTTQGDVYQQHNGSDSHCPGLG